MTEPFLRYPILIRGNFAEIELPSPDVEVMPGVRCGRPDEFLSPAYWAYQASADTVDWDDHHGLDAAKSLWEQVAFCLLGGHGVTYEVNLAAFRHLLDRGVFDEAQQAAAQSIEELLREPLDVGGRRVRYRFPRVKAGYLADAHRRVASDAIPTSARALRDWLLELKGIGPKTASWIVRNHLGSDDVAILDIHVLRAGRLAGLFSESDNVQRHYFEMEERFLRFAQGLGVRASQLDIVMWRQMRRSPTAIMAACDTLGISVNS